MTGRQRYKRAWYHDIAAKPWALSPTLSGQPSQVITGGRPTMGKNLNLAVTLGLLHAPLLWAAEEHVSAAEARAARQPPEIVCQITPAGRAMCTDHGGVRSYGKADPFASQTFARYRGIEGWIERDRFGRVIVRNPFYRGYYWR